MKAARWILVAVLTLGVTGAAYACDHAKASTQQASATSGTCAGMAKAAGTQCNGAKVASAGNCSKMMAAGQCSKMTAAHHDCVFCTFVSEVKANAGHVRVTTVDTDHGLTVVFAGMTDKDVAIAQAVADKAYAMMNAPAHCSYTRAKMAGKSCDGCKAGLGALADAEVSMEKTETGASTTVTVKDEKQAEELHTFFASLNETSEPAGE